MWVLGWILFWVGDIVSKPLYYFDWTARVLYPIYNNLMYWSLLLSDKYDLGIWGEPE